MSEAKVVAATGSTSSLGRGVRGKMIQDAMAGVVGELEKQAQKIWSNPDLSLEKKQAKINHLMSPENVLAEKMKARKLAKAAHDELAAQASLEATKRVEKSK